MNQVNTIVQKASGKLEVILAAMDSGHLSEEAQHGVQAMLVEIKTDIEAAGGLVPCGCCASPLPQ